MIRLILLVLTLCGPSLFTLPASAENSAINQSTNTDENTLRYTVGNHLYPAIFLDKATLAPSGYVVDLFKLIESQTGLRFEYIPLADGGSEASMFANKEIDIIPFENPRKARQNFGSGLSTIPYNSQRFLLIELNNVAMKIGIVARTQRAKTYLGDFIAPYQQPVFYNSIESLEADLKANKLDGIFLSEELITPEFLIANHQNITLSNARSITTLTSAMLFQEEHIAQYLKVNHFLTQLDSNTVTNLAKKYSRSEINIGYQPKTMAIILFISLLISLAVWLIYQKKHRSLEGALSNERARKRKADLAVDWFSSLLEGLPVGMLLTDKNGNELISNKLFRNKYNQYPLPNLDNLASKGVWSPEDQSVHFNFYKTDILHPESKELCHLILWDDVPQLEKQKSELASAHRVATDALAARARFTAMISHELKTPISGMQGSLELLHRKIHLEPENQVLIESVIQSAEQLERQLSEILDFSKADSGTMTLDNAPCNLVLELDQTLRLYHSACAEKGLQFQLDWQPTEYILANTDIDKIKQVLANLLSNAIKFTHCERISVAISLTKDVFQLKVKDSGIGMTPEQLVQIYTPYMQADSSISRQFGGTGLGMSIVKSIVELFNGEIAIQSESGIGTEITVRLPIATSPFSINEPVGIHFTSLIAQQWLVCWKVKTTDNIPLPTAQLDSDEECYPSLILERLGQNSLVLDKHDFFPPLQGHILVAEDNDIIRTVIKRQLEALGLSFVILPNGSDAYEQFESQPDDFQLILTDCHMPRLSGYELCSQVRHRAPELPIIGYTAYATEASHTKAKVAGMNELLIKPYSLTQLYQTLSKYLPQSNHTESPVAWLDKISAAEKNELLPVVVESYLKDISYLQAPDKRLKQQLHRIKGSANILKLDTLASAICQLEKMDAVPQKELDKVIKQLALIIEQGQAFLDKEKRK